MISCRGYAYWTLLVGVMAVLVLGACQASAGDQDRISGSLAGLPAATPPATQVEPAGEGQASVGETSINQDVKERMARVPTPASGAIVPTPAALRPKRAAVRGPADAPVTIVEFSDYQCPYCQRYVDEAYPQIVRNYIDSGQVHYVFKDFPLEQLHPQAGKAAEAARCAGEQDAYWRMHDALFAAQEDWSGQSDPVATFVDLGAALGLDQDALRSCLQSGRYRQAVLANLAEGQSLGVSGTPTLLINGYPLVGARPYDTFELAVGLAAAGRLGDAYARVPTPTPMPAADIPASSSPQLGSTDAPVVMIEYSDYQCPFCRRYNTETFPRVKENYVDTGKVRYVFKDFPLSIHAQASIAAQAARCAGDQGTYWGMHDLLYANQAEWSNAAAPEVLRGYAGELGLDVGAFASCLESGVHASAVEADLREGMSMGVSGTPAFFVGRLFISGAQPYEVFQQAIEEALSEQ